MKFLVSHYSCLQNPWLGVYRPQIPFSLSSIEFVEPPPEQNSWVRHWCPSSVRVVATFPGTILFPLLCSVFPFDWCFVAIFLSHSTQMLDAYIKTGHDNFFRHISSSSSTFSFYVDATTEVHKSKVSLARTTEFCTVTPRACGSSVWNLLHRTILAPSILRWFLDFRKIFVTLCKSIEIAAENL